MIRRYSELKRLTTFEERFDYLNLKGKVGDTTFGYNRYWNQILYTSRKWKRVRDEIIRRDLACDLGIEGREIYGKLMVHHMNVITVEDIEYERPEIYDPEFLICTTMSTHNAIHFGDTKLIQRLPIERKKNDTIPWL